MSFGQLAYKFFYLPSLPYRYNLKHYGFKGWLNYSIDEYQMKKSALSLPSINLTSVGEPLIAINFLTGERYWHQTLFCIQSMVNQSGNNLSIKIYSDGTINEKVQKIFHSYCPQIIICSEEEVLESLNTIIPVKKWKSVV